MHMYLLHTFVSNIPVHGVLARQQDVCLKTGGRLKKKRTKRKTIIHDGRSVYIKDLSANTLCCQRHVPSFCHFFLYPLFPLTCDAVIAFPSCHLPFFLLQLIIEPKQQKKGFSLLHLADFWLVKWCSRRHWHGRSHFS